MQPSVSTAIEERIVATRDLSWLPIEPVEKEKAERRVLERSERFDLIDAISARVEQRAMAAPHNVALTDDSRSFTYSELVVAFARVASVVGAFVSNTNPIVAVSGQRSASSVIAFLAIEKLGGIYLAVDENWPELRIRDVLGRTGARCVIVNDRSLASQNLIAAAAALDCQLVSVHEVLSGGTPSAADQLQKSLPPDPESPRYVLYTSGSTGQPKGAIVEHQGMVNHLLAKVLELQLSADDCIALTAPLTFDISIWQMLAALVVGGRVCVLDDETVLSPERMLDAVASKSITILEVVPTVLSLMLDEHERRSTSALGDLRYLLATGEALPPSTARRWISALPTVPLVNAYGPTECSDDVTHEVVSMPRDGQIHTPIGHPIPNSRLYVLVEENGSFRSCHDDEPGELFVGGICVGRGYLDDPVRTRAAFFRDPFVRDEHARLYRTGDLVRVTPSGALEYLGRIDRQVKVRGVRIELGEIEELLRSHGAVSEAAVVFLGSSESGESDRGDTRRLDDDARLVAFVSGAELASAMLRSFLSERLPRAMVPSEIRVLVELPLTANKKVDYRQLEAIARHRPGTDLQRASSVMYPHNALLHLVSAMQRHQLGAGTRSLHVGPASGAALETVLGLALGVTQILPSGSSTPTAHEISELCQSADVSLLSLSSDVSGALSSEEAASLRRQLTHVRVDHATVRGNAPLIAALSGDSSPVIVAHYEADAAVGVSEYVMPSEDSSASG